MDIRSRDREDDPGEARAAADVIARRTGVERHAVALVLGSGWAPAADLLGDALAEVPADEVPGFHPPISAAIASAIDSGVEVSKSIRRPAR